MFSFVILIPFVPGRGFATSGPAAAKLNNRHSSALMKWNDFIRTALCGFRNHKVRWIWRSISSHNLAQPHEVVYTKFHDGKILRVHVVAKTIETTRMDPI